MPRKRKPSPKAARRSELPKGTRTRADNQRHAARYVAKGGKSRRYVDMLTGEEISKREYDKRRRGVTNEQYRASRRAAGVRNPLARSKTWERGFQAAHLQRTGVKLTVRQVQQHTAYRDALDVIKHADPKRKHGPRSRLAKALVTLGLREASWDHFVGESNPDTVAIPGL